MDLLPLYGVLVLLAFIALWVVLGRLPRAARAWARTAYLTAVGGILVYGYGLFTMFVWDIRDACYTSSGRKLDVVYHPPTYFPLSSKCNPELDLVPGYVNPLLFTLLGATVLCAAVAVIRWLRQRRTAPRSPKEA
ncbi:hypothetical protein JOF53_004468 [Crossiella equi]|uniref:Uncharacterized protein n=1 Tax=Crossiella equi TaxID=130796 RepID=A0ABS5AGW9_9PSEU|nr:hypothetical protein [Crossiella equi]MBP2475596.1 hypothetical protein [Crossiella equi]